MSITESVRQPRLSRRQAITTGTAASMAALVAAPVASRAQEASPVAAAGGIDVAMAGLPAIVDEIMSRTDIPGVGVSVVYQDTQQLAAGYGVREAGVEGAVDADTVFQIASVSKCLASTVMAALVGDGDISWNTKMADIDPAFTLSDPWVTANVTLADLFSHRTGLPDHVGDALEDLGADRETVLRNLRFLDLPGSFRDSYAYTNFGLTAAADAAARFAGSTWEETSRLRLYEPLGMTRTTSVNAEFMAMDNRAVGHMMVDGEWVHVEDRQPDAQSPAGGVSSSVSDMSQWMRLQLANGMFDGVEVVASPGLEETHLPHAISRYPEHPSKEVAGFYGLGWNVRYDENGITLSHSGAFALGAATTVFLLPAEGLGITVLTNASPEGAAEAVALGFLDLYRHGAIQFDYLDAVGPIVKAAAAPEYGTEVAEPPSVVEEASAAEAYTGTYDNDFFGPLDVLEEGDGLVMQVGPAGMSFPLTHYTRDVFTYMPPGENGMITSAVTFTMGADGAASQVVVENLDLYGAGTFVRFAEGAEG
jgi:CubicO group peptidase (beta-lactamase class C family)